MKVAIVVMPFASEDGPALGASILRAVLLRAGIACDLHYLNLRFARQYGLSAYRAIDRNTPLLEGEKLFAAALWGSDSTGFIEECRRAIDWSNYDVVGFSSSFQQNTASLALAERLKNDHPRLRIVMGGANCEGEMGEELQRSFPFLDEVFSGESEHGFLEYVAGNARTGRPVDLDALPVPDFNDYYAQLDGLLRPDATHLKAETSRGCWWGERAHCTFCGLNGGTMKFRRKSVDRAIEELERLTRYPTRSVIMTDNILDEDAFAEFIPRLIDRKLGLRLFYEVKSSLTREQIAMLARAGVRRLQPGIESLSTATLGRMRKGTRAIENIALMKWAAEEGIALTWNWLTGFPKEEISREVIDQIPALHHLQAPTGLYNVEVHRFAPFHVDPKARGVGPIRPSRAYSDIYPFSEERLRRLAYFFERVEPPPSSPELAEAVTKWRDAASRGAALVMGERLVIDRRVDYEEVEISEEEERILIACDPPRILDASWKPEALARLIEKRYLLFLDGRYLSLAMNVFSNPRANAAIETARHAAYFAEGAGV